MIDFADPPTLDWWYYSDTNIHCKCGNYIELSGLTDKPKDFICALCGLKWQVSLIIKAVSENATICRETTEE